jgi:hypothetical protein
MSEIELPKNCHFRLGSLYLDFKKTAISKPFELQRWNFETKWQKKQLVVHKQLVVQLLQLDISNFQNGGRPWVWRYRRDEICWADTPWRMNLVEQDFSTIGGQSDALCQPWKGCFKGVPPTGHRRVGDDGPKWYFRESMATPCHTPMDICLILLWAPHLDSRKKIFDVE